ncbi:hypothetical protein BRADI_4g02214v3 [Brachypodium distachyon]|uniref:Uncharacterized protein n=1 Tax=Brachypodium distachyon TaxID=15368 RepID=A0A2K2CK00_BRADI|nr:hypothetical protein BRADI_4g02214v3 [Brachypodium distachyon]
MSTTHRVARLRSFSFAEPARHPCLCLPSSSRPPIPSSRMSSVCSGRTRDGGRAGATVSTAGSIVSYSCFLRPNALCSTLQELDEHSLGWASEERTARGRPTGTSTGIRNGSVLTPGWVEADLLIQCQSFKRAWPPVSTLYKF